jgi:RNA polymerase sigma-70 factor, ECF subfamily
MRTNAELIRAVLSGHQAAFKELVQRYERAVWATAWKILGDYHMAQDATQEAFVHAYLKLGQLRSPDHLGVWLLKIAHREATRSARRQARFQSLDTAENNTASEGEGLADSEAGELLQAVGRLPEHERLVVALRYLEGLPVSEIVRLTGRPVGTVTKQLSRGVERLRLAFREVSP